MNRTFTVFVSQRFNRGRWICIALATFLAFGCNDKVDRLQGQIDDLTAVMDTRLKDASDVGLISELGWLSKILRDSASGTPAEQRAAKEAVARLFGIDSSELSGSTFFEVTVQFSNFDLNGDQKLEADLKYLPVITPRGVAARFSAMPGNAWAGTDIRSPAEIRRTPAAIEELIKTRLTTLVRAGDCREIRHPGIGGGAGGFNTTSDCVGAIITGKSASSRNRSEAAGLSKQSAKDFVSDLTAIIMTPTEVAGLPPSGSFDGQLTQPWGLTAGTSPYAVLFVPQRQVAEHPSISVKAWLHLQGRPDRILGTSRQIPGVDFSERCLGKVPANPTPPVDSLTSVGKLCWYAFDLFGGGAMSQLDALTKEAAMRRRQAG